MTAALGLALAGLVLAVVLIWVGFVRALGGK
jgi:hypothetical protein